MIFSFSAKTTAGTVRPVNQDSCAVFTARLRGRGVLLAAVCDGLGGLQLGEAASSEVIRRLDDWFHNSLPRLEDGPSFLDAVQFRLSALLQNCSQGFFRYGRAHGLQLGTTAALLFLWEGSYLALNVGDSRLYQVGKGIRRLTRDQSFVARELERGAMTEEEARRHPKRNLLLQCVGGPGELSPGVSRGRAEGEETYLLCSDGLVHEVWEAEMETFLSPARASSREELEAALDTLIQRAMVRGERDNITGVAVRTAVDRPQGAPTLRQRLGRKPGGGLAGVPVFQPGDSLRLLAEQRIPQGWGEYF